MLQAKLIISGPLDEIAEVAALVATSTSGLDVLLADDEEVLGYTYERAKALLGRLAPRQRTVIETAVEHGGTIPETVLRDRFARGASGQVRGLTGPISKHVVRMVETGLLPRGTRPPVAAVYDPSNPSFPRASGMTMPRELVPIFAAALRSLP